VNIKSVSLFILGALTTLVVFTTQSTGYALDLKVLRLQPGSVYLFSVPMSLSDAELTFGDDTAAWHWDTKTQSWILNPKVEAGKSYFISSENKMDVILSGSTMTGHNNTILSISVGWNFIGVPFNQSVDLAKVGFRYDEKTYSLDDAVKAGLVYERIYQPDSSARFAWLTISDDSPSEELQPWIGYALFSAVDAQLVLLATGNFDQISQGKLGRGEGAGTGAPPPDFGSVPPTPPSTPTPPTDVAPPPSSGTPEPPSREPEPPIVVEPPDNRVNENPPTSEPPTPVPSGDKISIFKKYDSNKNGKLDDPEFFKITQDWLDDKYDNETFFVALDLWAEQRVVFSSGFGIRQTRVLAVATRSTHNAILFQAQGESVAGMMVQIFDLSGRTIVKQEVMGNKLVWNQRTATGISVPNGVYMYVATIRDASGKTIRTDVKKLSVVR